MIKVRIPSPPPSLYDKALIFQGFVVSGVCESVQPLEVVTKPFGNRYKIFLIFPLPGVLPTVKNPS